MTGTGTIDPSTDRRVYEIVLTAIDVWGGLGSMMQQRELPLLPSLIEASYILVLREERGVPVAEIAERLRVDRRKVESVFINPGAELVAACSPADGGGLETSSTVELDFTAGLPRGKRERECLAGVIANFAYAMVQRRTTEANQ